MAIEFLVFVDFPAFRVFNLAGLAVVVAVFTIDLLGDGWEERGSFSSLGELRVGWEG